MDRLGNLFVVATPIGNLKDITLRAIETLKEVNYIACEDTRRTRKLLSHFEIKGKKLISYFEQKERVEAKKILKLLKDGNDVALVSDAGTPCISDPGYVLVKLARENGVKVIPVPGPSAVIAALSASGFPTDKFIFMGFLPRKRGKLLETIGKIADLNVTAVAYESPHRIRTTLETIESEFPEIEIGIYREITKVNEEFLKGNAAELLKNIKGKEKGEFVLIFAPFKRREEIDIKDIIIELKNKGYSLKEAVREACKLTGFRKNTVYREALEIFGTEG